MGQSSFALIDLGILGQDAQDRKRLDVRPQSIQAWISELPLANVEEVAQRILTMLQTAHSTKIRAATRLRLLQLCEPTLAYLLDALQSQFMQPAIPMPRRNRNSASLANSLCEEMARGYRLVLLTDQGGLFGLWRKQRAMAAMGVCHYTGLALIKAWLLYENPPPGAWQLLHANWMDGVRGKLHRKPLQTPAVDVKFAGKQTLDEAYKQLLLCDAVGPWHMPRGEIAAVHQLLRQHARLASLIGIRNERAGEALFMVSPEMDAGVRNTGVGNASVHSAVTSGSLFICTRQLLPQLRIMLDRASARQTNTPQDTARQEAERLRRLIAYLDGSPANRPQRLPVDKGVHLVIGVNAIHRMMEQASQSAGKEGTGNSRFESRDLKKDLNRQQGDVWKTKYTRDLTESQREIPELALADMDMFINDPVAPGTAVPEAQGPLPPKPVGPGADFETGWVTVNSSSTGFCLQTAEGDRSRAQVGELVMVSENADMPRVHWQVGVIRWLRNKQSGLSQIGIQLIGANPVPAHVCVIRKNTKPSENNKCLLLPETAEPARSATLVTPALLHGMEQSVYFMYGSESVELLLTQELDGTGYFRQFTFEQISHRDPRMNKH